MVYIAVGSVEFGLGSLQQAELVFLGTGTSVGVPVIGCKCRTCTSSDPRDKRTRCSALLRLPRGNLLIDASPDLRAQLLREDISVVHAVLFTHAHADHVLGLDDLRVVAYHLGREVPLYCTLQVAETLRRMFSYAFDPHPDQKASRPRVRFNTIGQGPFEVLGVSVVPVPLDHGGCPVLGFRSGRFAYCTDVNSIPEPSWELLRGLELLVLDCLRITPHPTHFCLEESLEVIRRLRPARAFLTHVSHEVPHEELSRKLPPGVEVAWDGLRVPVKVQKSPVGTTTP